MSAFTPTSEQEAILSAFSEGRNLVVQAAAGTGKTTTLRMLTESTNRYGYYLAFNRAIAKEAESVFPSNRVRARTAHSLAWQEYGQQFSDRMQRGYLGWAGTIELVNATPVSFPKSDGTRARLNAFQVARHAVDTVKKFCQSADPAITKRHVPPIPGVASSSSEHDDLCDIILPKAKRVWADVQQEEGAVTYDHSYYLKGWALTNPRLTGDYILFDECQDAMPVLAGVVNAQTHMQRVFVGDASQQIMAFAGAVDAMAKFSRQPDVTTLSLTESFRFGPALADVANIFLADLRAPLRVTGAARHSTTVGLLDVPGAPDSDAVLCRTNAGAFIEVMAGMKAGRRVHLMGGAEETRKFANAVKDLQTKGTTNHPHLMAFESWGEVVDFVDDDDAEFELVKMVELVEAHGVDTILSALSAVSSEGAADLVVSTAHKAKGREWDRVRISHDFALDNEMPLPVLVAEQMLAYVAITRAKRHLDPGSLSQWIAEHIETGAGVPQAGSVAVPLPVPAPDVTGSGATDPDHSAFDGGTSGDSVAPSTGDSVESADPAETAPSPHVSEHQALVLPADIAARLEEAATAFDLDPHDLAHRILRGSLNAYLG